MHRSTVNVTVHVTVNATVNVTVNVNVTVMLYEFRIIDIKILSLIQFRFFNIV